MIGTNIFYERSLMIAHQKTRDMPSTRVLSSGTDMRAHCRLLNCTTGKRVCQRRRHFVSAQAPAGAELNLHEAPLPVARLPTPFLNM